MAKPRLPDKWQPEEWDWVTGWYKSVPIPRRKIKKFKLVPGFRRATPEEKKRMCVAWFISKPPEWAKKKEKKAKKQ